MMKTVLLIMVLMLSISYLKAQQDTVIYNQITGNYTVQYMNDDDSLITQTYIPRNKINSVIKCKVDYDYEHSKYIYEWTIKNNEDSKQNLNYFIIEFGDSNITDYSTCGWYGKRLRKPGGIGLANKYRWLGDQGLEPTWEVGGFILSSPGIPSIGDSYFQGSGGTILSFSNSPPPEKILRKINKIDGFPESYINRKTIVPGKIPEEVIPLHFIDTIKTYCDSSYQYGWIETEGILKSLKVKLENAKKNLINGEIEEAIDLLKAFIKEVEAQNGKKLTSEAYALLKFNAEYLIEQMEKDEE